MLLNLSQFLLDHGLAVVSCACLGRSWRLSGACSDQVLSVLWFRNYLVVNVVDVTLDCDILGHPSDLSILCSSSASSVILCSSVCLQLLESDHWADGHVVSEPWVFTDLMKLHSLLRIGLQ